MKSKKILILLLTILTLLFCIGCDNVSPSKSEESVVESSTAPKELKMADYLDISFDEIKDLFGNDYKVLEMSGWIPDYPGSDRVVRYDKSITNLEFLANYKYGEAPSTVADDTFFTEVRFYNNTNSDPLVIFDDIKTNITYGELNNKTNSILCDYEIEYIYSCKIDDKHYANFSYFEYPTESSIADYIIVTNDSHCWDSRFDLHNDDTITVTGKLTEESYEINSNNKGTVYILTLEKPTKYYKYEFTDTEFEKRELLVDSVEVDISIDEYIRYKGGTVTISGDILFVPLGHHQREIVLMDCVFR